MTVEGQISARERRRQRRSVFITPRARIVRTELMGETIFFTVTNRSDIIQSHHFRGGFYETEELAIIARYFPKGGRFCDIGANVGNHTLFATKILHAREVVCFEPNPTAIALLRSNLVLNRIETVVDQRYLGIGLSDAAAEATVSEFTNNLGGARLTAGGGDIRLARFDDLMPGQAFDLIKIDVEGMELRVLAGMKDTLAATRPKIFIEVDLTNLTAFESWHEASSYRVAERFQRYPENINFLLVPA